MKAKSQLAPLVQQISDAESPVGMYAVYVHALILDKLTQIEERLQRLEQQQQQQQQQQ